MSEEAKLPRAPGEEASAMSERSPVLDLEGRTRAADAVPIATPEYDHDVPGVPTLDGMVGWAGRFGKLPGIRERSTP